MSVPQAHQTPKLESLPKGLKDKAEAIINKKFGLVKKKKPSTFGIDVATGTDLSVSDLHDAFMKAKTRFMPNPALRVERIDYNHNSKTFDVIVRCMNCNVRQGNTVQLEVVQGRGYERAYGCRCGSDLFHIEDEDFRHAYMRDRGNQRGCNCDSCRGRTDPRFRDPRFRQEFTPVDIQF